MAHGVTIFLGEISKKFQYHTGRLDKKKGIKGPWFNLNLRKLWWDNKLQVFTEYLAVLRSVIIIKIVSQKSIYLKFNSNFTKIFKLTFNLAIRRQSQKKKFWICNIIFLKNSKSLIDIKNPFDTFRNNRHLIIQI